MEKICVHRKISRVFLKQISTFLLVILFCSIVFSPAFASTSSPEKSLETEKRNIFEFCDLYTYRLDKLSDCFLVNARHDITADYLYGGAAKHLPVKENEYYVQIPAGLLLVSVPDFEILRFEGTLLEYSDEENDENLIPLMRASAAYASLEYDGFKDYEYDRLYKTNQFDSFASHVNDELCDLLSEVINDPLLYGKLTSKNGNTVPLVSANYDYKLRYNCWSYDGKLYETLDLIAEAR